MQNWKIAKMCYLKPLILVVICYSTNRTWIHDASVTCTIFLIFIYLAVPSFSCDMWDLVSQPGIKPIPLHWKRGVLATGPPGKSLLVRFLKIKGNGNNELQACQWRKCEKWYQKSPSSLVEGREGHVFIFLCVSLRRLNSASTLRNIHFHRSPNTRLSDTVVINTQPERNFLPSYPLQLTQGTSTENKPMAMQKNKARYC